MSIRFAVLCVLVGASYCSSSCTDSARLTLLASSKLPICMQFVDHNRTHVRECFRPISIALDENMMQSVSVGETVTLHCSSRCGVIYWLVNGQMMMMGPNISTTCSRGQLGCPHCGCDNCCEAEPTQTLNTTITLQVNRDTEVHCMSKQLYQCCTATYILQLSRHIFKVALQSERLNIF